MRVKTSPFHCPSYCFSKPPHPLPPFLPSPATPLPPPLPPSPPPPPPPPLPPLPQHQAYALQTEDSHHTPSRSFPGSLTTEEKLCDEKVENDENGVDGGKKAYLLKSSLKKTASPNTKEIVKECVKWSDDLGKELVEIREFEPIESGELDGEMYGYPTCACVIL